MSCLKVKGGFPLCGTIHISGSKNEALPILCASLLTEHTTLHGVPDLSDTRAAAEILRSLGCAVNWGSSLEIQPPKKCTCNIPDELMARIRSSILFLAPLLHLCKHVCFTKPGGCDLGGRPINYHIDALTSMGAVFHERDSVIYGDCTGFHGGRVVLPYPSVGVTESVLMAAGVACSPTLLVGAAKEPEIVGLARFLQGCGVRIEGAGTDTITVFPAKSMGRTSYTISPDRMETVTAMCAVAATHGAAILENTDCNCVKNEIQTLRRSGVKILTYDDKIGVYYCGKRRPIHITTGPWPKFPTDAGPLFAALSAGGWKVKIKEQVFLNRFSFRSGFEQMGIKCSGKDRTILCHRINQGQDTCVTGEDLRATAALMIAALATEGTSKIFGLHHLLRGYENPTEKMQRMGAHIQEES